MNDFKGVEATKTCALTPCSALERIQPRVVSFEEQVAVLREALAATHQAEGDYSAAAQALAGIDLDSGEHLRHEPRYQ